MDGYNWGGVNGNGWQSFSQVFQQTYTDITTLAPNTPLMIAETASAESNGNKADWITDALTVQLPTYFPQVRAIIWFDENKETDWRINSSLASQTAFINAIASPTFASNTFKNLTGNVVPLSKR
jgi:endoglucanase